MVFGVFRNLEVILLPQQMNMFDIYCSVFSPKLVEMVQLSIFGVKNGLYSLVTIGSIVVTTLRVVAFVLTSGLVVGVVIGGIVASTG